MLYPSAALPGAELGEQSSATGRPFALVSITCSPVLALLQPCCLVIPSCVFHTRSCLPWPWRGVLSPDSTRGSSSQPSEAAFPSLCPFPTVCHCIVDPAVFIKCVLFHHQDRSLVVVLVSVFVFGCLAGFFFSPVLLLHCCLTPTSRNSTQ